MGREVPEEIRECHRKSPLQLDIAKKGTVFMVRAVRGEKYRRPLALQPPTPHTKSQILEKKNAHKQITKIDMAPVHSPQTAAC